jgi:hypothetical protein
MGIKVFFTSIPTRQLIGKRSMLLLRSAGFQSAVEFGHFGVPLADFSRREI